MAKIRPLRNAPITEAVVDFGARFASPPEKAAFDEFASQAKAAYPAQETRHEVGFTLRPGEVPTQISKYAGLLLRSADGLHAVQIKPDGFAFSRLKPYTSWDQMMDEAWKQWSAYVSIFKPERVFRVAARFINRLEIAGTLLDFDEYLTIMPKLPEGMPQQVSAFASTVTIPGIAPGTFGMVRTSFDAGSVKDSIPIILDIDIIRECDVEPADKALRLAIEELRPIKNAAFFGSLTEKAVEVFA